MKIQIAGKDRTEELRPALQAEAAERTRNPRCLFLPWYFHALSLGDQKSAPSFYDRYLELLRYKNHVNTVVFDIPSGRGPLARPWVLFKKILWKLLRYQHERMMFRQNLINSHLTSALEFQRDLWRDEAKALRARVEALEKRIGEPGGKP